VQNEHHYNAVGNSSSTARGTFYTSLFLAWNVIGLVVILFIDAAKWVVRAHDCGQIRLTLNIEHFVDYQSV
jgi:hypothetical protein